MVTLHSCLGAPGWTIWSLVLRSSGKRVRGRHRVGRLVGRLREFLRLPITSKSFWTCQKTINVNSIWVWFSVIILLLSGLRLNLCWSDHTRSAFVSREWVSLLAEQRYLGLSLLSNRYLGIQAHWRHITGSDSGLKAIWAAHLGVPPRLIVRIIFVANHVVFCGELIDARLHHLWLLGVAWLLAVTVEVFPRQWLDLIEQLRKWWTFEMHYLLFLGLNSLKLL
jgi:hypothetical protein